MSKLTLYGIWLSGPTYKAGLALSLMGQPFAYKHVDLRAGAHKQPEYLAINRFGQVPALVDGDLKLCQSGSILLYLADKFGAFIPQDPSERAECLSWLFWQMGAAPYLGGGFGHFYAYAPWKMEYPINRYTMEVKRQLDVLDQNLADRRFVAGDDYTIADMAIWPWYGVLTTGGVYSGEGYDAAEFLDAQSYRNVVRWTEEIAARPAVRRGRMVNRISGPLEGQLRERHAAGDFETRTQDRLEAAN